MQHNGTNDNGEGKCHDLSGADGLLGLTIYTIQGSTPKDTIEERILDLQDKKAELLALLD